ncbi:hypothetical protein CAPTEDRAFT_205469, partial [Capitella teleta]
MMPPSLAMPVTSMVAPSITLSFPWFRDNSFLSPPCRIPGYIQGDFYSLKDGTENLNFLVKRNSIVDKNTKLEAKCVELDHLPNATQYVDNAVTRILVQYQAWDKCYTCYEVTYKTPNILQVIRSACLDLPNPESNGLNRMCGHINRAHRPQIWFKKKPEPINCNLTFSGNYSFSYSSCESPNNRLEACFNPLTRYAHNEALWLSFGECRGKSLPFEKSKMELQCLGSWPDDDGWFYSGLMDPTELYYKHRFLCIRHMDDRTFSLSTIAYCYFDSWHETMDVSLTALEVCPQFLYSSCSLSDEFIGKYLSEDETMDIHADGIVLPGGEDASCFKKRPGTGVNAEGAAGVMRSTELLLRWDDPDKKYRYNQLEMQIDAFKLCINYLSICIAESLSAFKYKQEKPGFELCVESQQSHVYTVFKSSLEPQICSPSQLLANYQFTYRDGNIMDTCKSDMNTAEGCPSDASGEQDLQGVYSTYFNMTFGACDDTNATSVSDSYSFICLGSWEDTQGNFIIALFDASNPSGRKAFRCMLTSKDVIQPIDEGIPYVMSSGSQCREVVSPYEGPIQLEFTRVAECVQTTTTSMELSTLRSPIDQELIGDYWMPIGSSSKLSIPWPYILMVGYLVTCFNHVVP